MRIISGSLKGKRIRVPKNFPSRPTTDYAKEGLFNILENTIDFYQLDILDLCSGTGNISFEFISRGAHFVMSVDSSPISTSFQKKTINELKIEKNKIQLYKADCIVFCKNSTKKFDLIFADLPFNLKIHDQLIEAVFKGDILNENGKLIVEHGVKDTFEKHQEFSFSRKFGNVKFSFFNF